MASEHGSETGVSYGIVSSLAMFEALPLLIAARFACMLNHCNPLQLTSSNLFCRYNLLRARNTQLFSQLNSATKALKGSPCAGGVLSPHSAMRGGVSLSSPNAGGGNGRFLQY